MIKFYYHHIKSIEDCYIVVDSFGLVGNKVNEKMKTNTMVFVSPDFIGYWSEGYSLLMLLPLKNTNSINYFIRKYPNFQWDDYQIERTKRWKD